MTSKTTPNQPANHEAESALDESSGGIGGITALSIRRPLFMLMVILSVMIFGLIAYGRLGVDLFPSVNFPVVSVSIPYPGASPEVVESLVTRPVEDAVSGLADLDTINSTSSEGVAVVIVTFKDKADPQTVAIEVEKRVNGIRGQLPNDIIAPTILKFDFTAAPIITLGLTGANVTPAQAFRIADELVRPKLETTNGVGQVSIFGGQQREVQVKVDPNRLRAYNLTLAQVSQALGSENIDAPGGRVDDGSRNLNIRLDARFRSVDQIRDTVVQALPTGGTIRVRDLAEVIDGYKEQTFLARVNGGPGVGISVSKQSSSNVTQTAANVRATLAKIRTTLPEGVELVGIQDSSEFITSSLNGVQRTLLEANILTGIVLLAFLHSWRSTLIVLLAIPTSLIATFAFMYLQGFTFNFLTTLALTLTVGILVDDSIVVLENIFQFLKRGDSPRVAAVRGRAEIGLAALAITLVDVVVFAPVGLLSGQIGQFFRQFGFTVVAATLASLAVSFTLTPLLASRWLSSEDEHGTGPLAIFGRWWDRGFDRLEDRYRGILRWSLSHRWVIMLVAVLSFVGAIGLPVAGLVKTSFFPNQDQGTFNILLELPPGSTLEATASAVAQMEAGITKLPEFKAIYSVIGQGEGGTSRQSRFANLQVILVGKRERTKSVEQLAREVKVFGEGFPGLKVRAGVPGPGGGGSQPVSLRVYGDDLKVLNDLADKIIGKFRETGGLVDITNSGQAGAPEYVVTLDRAKAADLGLSAGQVAQTLRTAYAGSVATTLRRDQTSGTASGVDVRVQLTDDTRKDITLLQQVPLISPAKGGQVYLGQIATVAPAAGPSQIQRTDRQRALTIGANIGEGLILSDVTKRVNEAIASVEVPAGYRIKIGGQADQQSSTFTEFGNALLLSIALVYILLVALYESLLYPLIVIAALPLALVGAMSGLALGQETLNTFSLIGIIALVGLVGKNSILVIDYTNTLRREQGMGRFDALMEAGPRRLRPILMTSSALIFAQIPVMLKIEDGAEVQSPIGWVIFGGMISSTILALVFVPTLYTLVDDFQNWILRGFKRDRSRGPKEKDMNGSGSSTSGNNDEIVARPATEKVGIGATVSRIATTGTNLAVAIVAVGGLFLSACGAQPDTAKAAPVAPPLNVAVVDARKETVRASVTSSGAVEATDQVSVSAKVSGRVTRLDAEVGQNVKAGQLIAELDRVIIEAQVAQAEAGLMGAQVRLGQLERGPRADDVAVAAAQRTAAEKQADAVASQAAVAEQSLTTFDAQIDAATNQANASKASAQAAKTQSQGARAQASGARNQANAARAQANAAKVRLDQLKNPRPEDLALLESQVETAKIRLSQASQRDEEIRVVQAQVEAARLALQQAQDPARPEQLRAAQAQLDVAKATLSNLTEAPVRAEDLESIRLAYESADKAYEASGDSLRIAEKAYDAAKRSRSTYGPAVVSDSVLAQAEGGVVAAQANIEQARIRRDTARESYNKAQAGATGWDLRKTQLAVEAAQATVDLTRNPDPVRVKNAQLTLEQAQLNLELRQRQIGFDLQTAKEGLKVAENQRAKVVNPGEFDIKSLEEASKAAEAQALGAEASAQAAEASADASAIQAEAAASQAAAAAAQVNALLSQRTGAESQIAGARSQADGARATADQAASAYKLRANPYTEDDLKTARVGVAQAEAAVRLAQANLAETYIYAPIDGVITARNTSIGSLLNPGQAVVTVISSAIEITIPVEEAKVGSVKEGQSVTMTSPALPGVSLEGKINAVTPSGDTRNRSFTARVRLVKPDTRLRPGMFVNTSIATEERANAIVVNRESIILTNGKSQLFVVGAGNKVESRAVKVGLSTGTLVEVLEGVSAGDKVIVTGVEDLRDGQVVTPVSK